MESISQANVLSIHTKALFEEAVERVAQWLGQGGVAVVPTETVYGLAANALDPDAVRQIYRIKDRPARNPLIVHVADVAMARDCCREWPEVAGRLAAHFWPGPLTLVLAKSRVIPEVVVAGGDSVAIRWPGHPFMQAVIRRCGFPVAAPSANLANAISPTRLEHVMGSLGSKVAMIVDGGVCQVGIESTVLDLTVDPPRVLRPGMIGEAGLMAVTGALGGMERRWLDEGEGKLSSPGLMARHYAPRARLRVMSWEDDEDLRGQLERLGAELGEVHVIAHAKIPSVGGLGRVSVIPHDAEAYARAMYGEWHVSDAMGAGWIVVEAVPEGDAWSGIADRLRRASR